MGQLLSILHCQKLPGNISICYLYSLYICLATTLSYANIDCSNKCNEYFEMLKKLRNVRVQSVA